MADETRAFWHVRVHVAMSDVAGDEAAQLAADLIASVSQDDGNWTLAVTGAAAVGPYDAEDAEDADREGEGPEEEVIVTLEVENVSSAGAVCTAAYWMEGLWESDIRLLYIEEDPTRAVRPAGAAHNLFGALAGRLGGAPCPYGETITVGGVDVRLNLMDRRSDGRQIVQLYSIDLDEDARGSGLGTRTVQQLLAAAADQNVDVLVGPITNDGFWDRFEDLHDLGISYLGVGGGYMGTRTSGYDERILDHIEHW